MFFVRKTLLRKQSKQIPTSGESNLNPELRIEGVLLTMLDGRTNIGLEVIEEVRKYFKNKVFNTIIPRLVRLVEAPSHGKPISDLQKR